MTGIDELVYMKIEKPDFEALKPLRLSEFVDSVEIYSSKQPKTVC
jgi:hypothetical protein